MLKGEITVDIFVTIAGKIVRFPHDIFNVLNSYRILIHTENCPNLRELSLVSTTVQNTKNQMRNTTWTIPTDSDVEDNNNNNNNKKAEEEKEKEKEKDSSEALQLGKDKFDKMVSLQLVKLSLDGIECTSVDIVSIMHQLTVLEEFG